MIYEMGVVLGVMAGVFGVMIHIADMALRRFSRTGSARSRDILLYTGLAVGIALLVTARGGVDESPTAIISVVAGIGIWFQLFSQRGRAGIGVSLVMALLMWGSSILVQMGVGVLVGSVGALTPLDASWSPLVPLMVGLVVGGLGIAIFLRSHRIKKRNRQIAAGALKL